MREALLFVWQLPQSMLGILLIFASGAREIEYPSTPAYWRSIFTVKRFGAVSLGEYRIMFSTPDRLTVLHEWGHTRQSRLLGPLYLVVIGLPSLVGNLLWRVFRYNYYGQPWEAWADRLGGVNRK